MKIICIGRNYRDHIRELNSPLPTEPVFFLKPDTSLLTRNRPFYFPDFSNEIHYEIELVIRISRLGKNIQEKFADTYYDAVTAGLDFTARDIQDRCKKQGLPWLISKGFDQAAPIGKFLPRSDFKDMKNIHFHLELNGNTVQQGSSADMIFSFEDIISYVSKYMTLRTGDLIYTGTPSGVGPVKIGDRLDAYIEGKKLLSCPVK
jgi:2-keto-4-pentenoate hydratase/2-oxohepta-3-ene-1,7-dioic acid hydratase in catechol pathway